MMKKALFILSVIVLMLLASAAFADPARFLKNDRNSAYHAGHLLEHIGSGNCKVSGNYIKVRPSPGSNSVLGHVEQSDAFTLDAVDGNWAQITVVYAAKGSPDSRVGLSGWVNADYVECPCSRDEYYDGPAHTTYSRAVISQDPVNLRELPTKTSTKMAVLHIGESVDVLSEYTGKDKRIWYRVRYGRQMGFVREDMVEITESNLPEFSSERSANEANADGENGPASPPDTASASPEFTGEPGSWQQVYHDFLLGKQYRIRQDPDDSEIWYDLFGQAYYVGQYGIISFGLWDMDGNGIPELVSNNGYPDGGWSAAHIYTSMNGLLVYLGSLGNRAGGPYVVADANYPGIVTASGNMGIFGTEYTELRNGELYSVNVYTESYIDPNDEYSDLETPIITIDTSDTRLFEAIRNDSRDAAWYTEPDISESTWPAFVESATRVQTEKPAAPVEEAGRTTSSAVLTDRESWLNAAMNNSTVFHDVLLDTAVYRGSWQETYLEILRKNEKLIRHHINSSKPAAEYREGADFFIMFCDLTRDSIPEMLFIMSVDTDDSDAAIGDLYIYSGDGSETRCVLSIPEVYSPVSDGEDYSLFIEPDRPAVLCISYYDGGSWLVEYDTANLFQRGSTWRGTYIIDDDINIADYYLNGNRIPESEWKAQASREKSNAIHMLASINLKARETGMDYDAAIRYLSGASDGQQNQPNQPTQPDAQNQPDQPVQSAQQNQPAQQTQQNQPTQQAQQNQPTQQNRSGSVSAVSYPCKAATAKPNVNIRKKPNKNSQLVTKIQTQGIIVTVLSDTQDKAGTLWYCIRTDDGKAGYVRDDMLKLIPNS